MSYQPHAKPLAALLVIVGWHGATATPVVSIGSTPKRFRIRAITRTRLAGRMRWLEPGQETLVPKTAVRHTGALYVETTEQAQ